MTIMQRTKYTLLHYPPYVLPLQDFSGHLCSVLLKTLYAFEVSINLCLILLSQNKFGFLEIFRT